MNRLSPLFLLAGIHCLVAALYLDGAPMRRFDMSGKVTGVHPSHYVTVRIEGPVKRVATVRPDGTWRVASLPEGRYVVTPHNDKYTFTPSSRDVLLRTQDARYVNFDARMVGVTTTSQSTTVTHFSVRGHVSGLEPRQHAWVRVQNARTQRSASTGADGSFEVKNLLPGTYVVKPEKPGYTFTPASRTVNLKSGDVEGLEFKARRQSSR